MNYTYSEIPDLIRIPKNILLVCTIHRGISCTITILSFAISCLYLRYQEEKKFHQRCAHAILHILLECVRSRASSNFTEPGLASSDNFIYRVGGPNETRTGLC